MLRDARFFDKNTLRTFEDEIEEQCFIKRMNEERETLTKFKALRDEEKEWEERKAVIKPSSSNLDFSDAITPKRIQQKDPCLELRKKVLGFSGTEREAYYRSIFEFDQVFEDINLVGIPSNIYLELDRNKGRFSFYQKGNKFIFVSFQFLILHELCETEDGHSYLKKVFEIPLFQKTSPEDNKALVKLQLVPVGDLVFASTFVAQRQNQESESHYKISVALVDISAPKETLSTAQIISKAASTSFQITDIVFSYPDQVAIVAAKFNYGEVYTYWRQRIDNYSYGAILFKMNFTAKTLDYEKDFTIGNANHSSKNENGIIQFQIWPGGNIWSYKTLQYSFEYTPRPDNLIWLASHNKLSFLRYYSEEHKTTGQLSNLVSNNLDIQWDVNDGLDKGIDDVLNTHIPSRPLHGIIKDYAKSPHIIFSAPVRLVDPSYDVRAHHNCDVKESYKKLNLWLDILKTEMDNPKKKYKLEMYGLLSYFKELLLNTRKNYTQCVDQAFSRFPKLVARGKSRRARFNERVNGGGGRFGGSCRIVRFLEKFKEYDIPEKEFKASFNP